MVFMALRVPSEPWMPLASIYKVPSIPGGFMDFFLGGGPFFVPFIESIPF